MSFEYILLKCRLDKFSRKKSHSTLSLLHPWCTLWRQNLRFHLPSTKSTDSGELHDRTRISRAIIRNLPTWRRIGKSCRVRVTQERKRRRRETDGVEKEGWKESRETGRRRTGRCRVIYPHGTWHCRSRLPGSRRRDTGDSIRNGRVPAILRDTSEGTSY